MDWNAVKMVGLDMDGTVLTDDKRVTERTRAAVIAAVSRGIVVLPATGRPIAGIPERFAGIPGIRYLLGSNGAAVYDKEESRFVVHCCMDRETVLRAMDLYQKRDCTFELYLDGTPYIGAEDFSRIEYLIPDPFIRSYVRATRKVVPDIREFFQRDGRGAEKINMCFPTPEEADAGIALLERLPEVTGVQGLPMNLELSKRGVDKGEGLLMLADALHIPHECVMACGDSDNDLAMIRKSGIGAAMPNGKESVKRAADFVLPYTNQEEGIAWLLEEIVKQQYK